MNVRKEEWDAKALDLHNLSAEVDALRAKLRTQTEENEKLKKELESSKSSLNYHASRETDKDRELEEIGTVLDMVDDPPPRKTGTDTMKDYERHDLTVLSRLTVWLAKNAMAKLTAR